MTSLGIDVKAMKTQMMESRALRPTSNQTNKELFYCVNNCFFNAKRNKDNAYKGKSLRLVVGSVAFNGWFEFGQEKWTTISEWRKNAHKGKTTWDAHCWLEDADGNIYDYVFEDYLHIAEMRNGCGPMKAGLLEGVSKKNCKKRGMLYVPAPANVQELILKSFADAGWDLS